LQVYFKSYQDNQTSAPVSDIVKGDSDIEMESDMSVAQLDSKLSPEETNHPTIESLQSKVITLEQEKERLYSVLDSQRKHLYDCIRDLSGETFTSVLNELGLTADDLHLPTFAEMLEILNQLSSLRQQTLQPTEVSDTNVSKSFDSRLLLSNDDAYSDNNYRRCTVGSLPPESERILKDKITKLESQLDMTKNRARQLLCFLKDGLQEIINNPPDSEGKNTQTTLTQPCQKCSQLLQEREYMEKAYDKQVDSLENELMMIKGRHTNLEKQLSQSIDQGSKLKERKIELEHRINVLELQIEAQTKPNNDSGKIGNIILKHKNNRGKHRIEFEGNLR
jgi:cell division protein FtsB